MRSTACILFTIIGFAVGQTSLDPPVFLADGSEFTTWEQPLEFSKTYHVDQNHSDASDQGPGTADQPFATIGAAAEVLQAGERAVIHAGVYREMVRPPRGGSGPAQMISYEAAPGEEVILKGSQEIQTTWTDLGNNQWRASLPSSAFAEHGYNPFAMENLTHEEVQYMPWAVDKPGNYPYNLRRGLIFQNGQRLVQVAGTGDLSEGPGRYHVSDDGLSVTVRPFGDTDPNNETMEFTALKHLFMPQTVELAYIRVKGLIMEQVGNGLKRIGEGVLFTYGGHHWIIEGNTVRQAAGTGIEFGFNVVEAQFGEPGPQRTDETDTWHIVRGNIISECGSAGIRCHRVGRGLVEHNHIWNIGWQNVELYWETAGIKLLITNHCLVRRNVIHNTLDAPGIWLDWDNKNSRVTQNIIYDIRSVQGGVFIEASMTPNWVDRNIIWNVEGFGYYSHDTDVALLAHNLIGHTTRTAIHFSPGAAGRMGDGIDNTAANNIFVETSGNVSYDHSSNRDLNNVSTSGYTIDAVFEADPDQASFTITWQDSDNFPLVSRVDGLSELDYFDQPWPAGDVPAGPFAYPDGQTLSLDQQTDMPHARLCTNRKGMFQILFRRGEIEFNTTGRRVESSSHIAGR
jgi:hypothetical protein